MILFGEPKPSRRPTPGEHLPAVPEPVGPGGDAFSALDLKRFAQAALGRLGALGVDVNVSSLEDGRVSLALAPAWAELFLANLEAQAQEFKWRLHRARCEAAIREAEVRRDLREAGLRADREDLAIKREYGRLRAAGLSHREALQELKRQFGGRLGTTELSWIVPRESRAKRRRTAAGQPASPGTPDSPDELARLWAEHPAPTLARFTGEVVRYWWAWKERRFSWRRIFPRRGRLSARVLWAAFSRDQAWHYLWHTLRERHQLREAKIALRTGCSPRTGIPLHPNRLRAFARDLEFRKSRTFERYEEYCLAVSPKAHEGRVAERNRQHALGISWFNQRWLPEAEALVQLRAHGVAV